MGYRYKLQLMIVLLLAFSVGLSGTWLITASFDDALGREVSAAQTEQRMALYMLAAAGKSEDAWISTIRTLEQQASQSFRLATSDTLYQREGSSFSDALKNKATAQNMAWCIWQDNTGAHLLQIAGVLEIEGEMVYLEALRPVEEVYNARAALSRDFIWLMAAAAVMGTLAAALLSHWLTASLTRLAETARAITDGDMARRAAENGQDEIGQLARDFNTMADRLSENIHALEQAMARQEEFMASFAHEMRTPMTSIIGYADLLRSQQLPHEVRADAANYIFTEGRRLEALSNKLLDLIVLGRKDFPRRPCRMKRLIAQVGGFYDQTLRSAGIALHCRVDHACCTVEPDLFQTLLINLLDNARKAMPEGGKITLTAGQMQDGAWRMTLTDTGQGIPPASLPRLTEAFYRVDKARSRASGGVGLGLRLCAEIVRLHEGTLGFDSKEGEGTTVTVTLKGGIPEDGTQSKPESQGESLDQTNTVGNAANQCID